MRRIIGILAIALALIGGNLALASATTSSGSSTDPQTKTLRLLLTNVDSANLDLGDTGPSLGDQFISTDNVSQSGKRVGQAHLDCTVTRLVSQSAFTFQCLGTLVLPAGQITAQGAPTLTEGPSRITLAVTGGTGAYRTARGQLVSREISATRSELTVQLVL